METSTEALSYSLDALRVKALFYNKKAMVYVEGPEDINFWDPYFDSDVFEIESVNGCQNLKPHEDKPVVFGDTCANYCNTTAPCYELDDARIKKFCDDNERFYPNEELERVETEIQKDGRDERFLIKGHFLTDGVRRFINFLSKNAHPTGSKSNISSNELYALCVHCSNCRIKDCEENKYIIMLVTNAIIHLEVV